MKRCEKCHRQRRLAEYHANGRGGLAKACKACRNAEAARWMQELRALAIAALGGRCKQCGYDENVNALHIDHVAHDGARERRDPAYGWSRLYRKIATFGGQGRYQLLCANCNSIKRMAHAGERGRGITRHRPQKRTVQSRPLRRTPKTPQDALNAKRPPPAPGGADEGQGVAGFSGV